MQEGVAFRGDVMRLLRSLIPDLFLVAIATVLAVALRDNFDVSQDQIAALLPYATLTGIFAAIMLPSFGVTHSMWRFTSMRDYLSIVAAAGAIIVGALVAGFVINRLEGIARSLPILQGLLMVSLLVGARIAARVRHASSIRPARSPIPRPTQDTVLVVGLNRLTELYLHCAAELAAERVRIAGILDPGGHVGQSLYGHRVLGAPEQVADMLRDLEIRGVFVNRIVVTLPLNSLAPAARDALRTVEANTTIAIEFLDQKMGFEHPVAGAGERASQAIQPMADEQVFAFSAADAFKKSPYVRVKRALDIVAAFVLLVALSPLMALVGILVAYDVGLPILFWQQRPGLAGRPFRVYKFRTMGAAHDACGRRRPDSRADFGNRACLAPHAARRTPAAVQHPGRPHVVCRTAAAASGRPVRKLCGAVAGAPWPHRLGAGQGRARDLRCRQSRARRLVRQQPVLGARCEDPIGHRADGPVWRAGDPSSDYSGLARPARRRHLFGERVTPKPVLVCSDR